MKLTRAFVSPDSLQSAVSIALIAPASLTPLDGEIDPRAAVVQRPNEGEKFEPLGHDRLVVARSSFRQRTPFRNYSIFQKGMRTPFIAGRRD